MDLVMKSSLKIVFMDKDFRTSIMPLAINILVTLIVLFFLTNTGTLVEQIDYVDFGVETASSLTYFLLYWSVYLMGLRRDLKYLFATSFLIIQLGRLVDAIDEIVIYNVSHASAIGDALTLFGEIILVFSAIRWILLTSLQANTDPLTGLFNRRYHLKEIERFIERSSETAISFAIIVMDIDRFKPINDQYGHAFGDTVLQHCAKLLRTVSRPEDIISRVGGEEFEILLPRCDQAQAMMVAERMRKAMATTPPEGLKELTASFGVTVYRRGSSSRELRDLADVALYTSKKEGRNRVSFRSSKC